MSSQNISHPYLESHRGHRRAYIVMAGDKGMAGSYNETVLSFAYQETSSATRAATWPPWASSPTTSSARRAWCRTTRWWAWRKTPRSTTPWRSPRRSSTSSTRGQVDEICVIFTLYAVSGKVVNQPIMQRVLPIRLTDFQNVPTSHDLRDAIYTPSPQEVFDQLVPQFHHLPGLRRPGAGLRGGALCPHERHAERHEERRGAPQNPQSAAQHGAADENHPGDHRDRRGQRRPFPRTARNKPIRRRTTWTRTSTAP